MIIKVPTFGMNGYVNIGDAAVLISAWLLGNPYGAFAAGIGSGLADLLSGYPAYILQVISTCADHDAVAAGKA